MADLSITAASVAKSTGAVVDNQYLAAATITAGQLVYLTTSNTWNLVDNDAAATSTVGGVALHGSLAGQPLAVQSAGNINLGATLTVGAIYGSSSTAGAIAPVSDHTTGDYVSILGIGISASILQMTRVNSGIVHA